jgi:superfamily I DNA/RNA helicase
MEVWVEEFMTFLREKNPELIKLLQTYKVLIVDEFQDLDEVQFDFVALFKQIQPTLRILAIGDLAQNIYRFRGTSNEFLRTRLHKEVCSDLKTFELTTNFRSTKSILRVVNTIFAWEIEHKHILPMIPGPAAPEGKKPTYYEYARNPESGMGAYEELVANTLYPMLVQAKSESKSIVLIFPIIKCQSFELIMALLKHTSKHGGFKLDLHKIAKEDESCRTVSFRYDTRDPTSPVQFSSIHSSKGLEWDIVALIDMSDYIYDLRGAEDCEAFYAEKTNLTYVAITRAAE